VQQIPRSTISLDSKNEKKLYVNERYGFAFSFPADWKLVSEEGKPYDYENFEGENYSGFAVTLAKNGWKYKIAFNPFFDDLSYAKTDYLEEISIDGKVRLRVAYLILENGEATKF